MANGNPSGGVERGKHDEKTAAENHLAGRWRHIVTTGTGFVEKPSCDRLARFHCSVGYPPPRLLASVELLEIRLKCKD